MSSCQTFSLIELHVKLPIKINTKHLTTSLEKPMLLCVYIFCWASLTTHRLWRIHSECSWPLAINVQLALNATHFTDNKFVYSDALCQSSYNIYNTKLIECMFRQYYDWTQVKMPTTIKWFVVVRPAQKRIWSWHGPLYARQLYRTMMPPPPRTHKTLNPFDRAT